MSNNFHVTPATKQSTGSLSLKEHNKLVSRLRSAFSGFFEQTRVNVQEIRLTEAAQSASLVEVLSSNFQSPDQENSLTSEENETTQERELTASR